MATEKEKEKERFTKTDMERVALFQEMGYITVGDKYKSVDTAAFNESASRGKQMLPGGPKAKSALPAGYFSDKFSRVLEGEAYSDQVKMRRQYRQKEAQKNIGKPFIPSSGEKKMSGAGSYYGSLSGPIPAISPQTKPAPEYKSPGKNLYTNPAKKGTGYGYANVTLSTYSKHETDEFDRPRQAMKRENDAHKKAVKGSAFRLNMAPREYFDENPFKTDRPLPPAKKMHERKLDFKPFKPSSPAKQDGGMKAGTFEPYPSHSADPYRAKTSAARNVSASANKSGKTFFPPQGPKSAPSTSVLDQNIVRSINVQNFRTVHSVMSY